MKPTLARRFFTFFFVYLPATITAIGVLALIGLRLSFDKSALPLVPAFIPEMANTPLDYFSMGFASFSVDTQSYLIFQVFESLPPLTFPLASQVMGLLVWFLFSLGVLLITGLRRYAFLAGMGLAIGIMAVSGFNELGITFLGPNSGLLLALCTLLLPALLTHTFFPNLPWLSRSLIVMASALVGWFLLILQATVPAPTLLIAENSSLAALIVAAVFLAYTGHALIGGLYVLLAKLNTGVGIKITWQFTLLSIGYITLVSLIYLRLIGEIQVSFLLPPTYLIFIVAGTVGYFDVRRKLSQIPQPFGSPFVGEGIYLVGFALTAWVWFKAELTVNAPMADYLHHLLLYAQIGFGSLFFLYLIANFLGVMNSGNPVEKIMYKPPFFPYIHMRLGGLLSMLVLGIYSDGIVSVQFPTASINLSADYYQAIGQKREAAILYEQSFDRYRNNPKSLNAVAHYYLELRQPTPATQALIRSIEERPNVNDIILLASRLQQVNKNSDALYYLIEGVNQFPESDHLRNNLAVLQSKLNQETEALANFKQMVKETSTRDANIQATYGKHMATLGWTDEELSGNVVGQINRMANYNHTGELAPMQLQLDTIAHPILTNRAILRNQWVNKPYQALESEIHILDSLLQQELLASHLAEILETRVVRHYQALNINTALHTLENLTFQFGGSAGFFHSMQARIRMSQMDFTRAADAWIAAEQKGYTAITSDLLPVIYFGKREEDADLLADKYNLSYPTWMQRDASGTLIENDTLHLVRALARLLPATENDLFSPLEAIGNTELRAYYAFQLILRKAHWLEKAQLDELATYITTANPDAQVDPVISFFRDGKVDADKLPNSLFPYLPTDLAANAYWTPLVLHAVKEAEDPTKAYNILHLATRFNPDPLLWISLVKYSRQIGQDNYAAAYLTEMNEWVNGEELIDLQLRHLFNEE